jgi:hypothetical protein
LTVIIILYFITEILAFVASGILSSRPPVLRYLYISPFMVFIYKPFCIFVHLYSYITVLGRKKKSNGKDNLNRNQSKDHSPTLFHLWFYYEILIYYILSINS